MPRKEWYVLTTEPKLTREGVSYPDVRVRREIKRKAKTEGLEKFVGRVLIVRHRVTEVRAGRIIQCNRKAFPGYILVKMSWSDNVHALIKSVRGVTGILPTLPPLTGTKYGGKGRGKSIRKPTKKEVEAAMSWKPIPVDEDQVQWLLLRIKKMAYQETVGYGFEPGEAVKIKDDSGSSLASQEGVVERNGHKVLVKVLLLGQEVLVELEPFQIERRKK